MRRLVFIALVWSPHPLFGNHILTDPVSYPVPAREGCTFFGLPPCGPTPGFQSVAVSGPKVDLAHLTDPDHARPAAHGLVVVEPNEVTRLYGRPALEAAPAREPGGRRALLSKDGIEGDRKSVV